jgi:plastocyanin
MTRPTQLLAIGLTGALALGLAACGSDSNDDSGASTPSASTPRTSTTSKTSTAAAGGAGGGGGGSTLAVKATEFKFTPANPTVKAGTVAIKLSNDGQTTHQLEVEGPSGEVESAVLQPGQSDTLRVKLNKAGSYEWYCPIGNHRQMGMEGEITVQG